MPTTATTQEQQHTIGIKVLLAENYIRRFRIPRETTLQAFWSILHAKLENAKLDGFVLQYRDADKDWVYCALEDEWEEAIFQCESCLCISLLPVRKAPFVVDQQQHVQIKANSNSTTPAATTTTTQHQALPVVVTPVVESVPSTTNSTVVVASPTQPSQIWSTHLTKLQEMGFTNRSQLTFLLQKHNGSLPAVVQEVMAPNGVYTPLSIRFSPAANRFKIMSFNLRFDTEQDKHDCWLNRKQGVLERIIYKYAPDVLGVQEALMHQYQFLQTHMKNYQSVSIGREFDLSKKEHYGMQLVALVIICKLGEHCSIFFNSEKFTLIKSGTFWLSETPDKEGTKGWDADCTRICTFALLYIVAMQEVVLVANTHWDHVSHTAQIKSAELIKKYLGKVYTEAKPCGIILLGDFNCEISTDALQSLESYNATADHFRLSNVREMLKDKLECISGPETTFPGFQDQYKLRIDHIYVSEGIVPQNYACIDDLLDTGRKPSDHRPILATLSVPSCKN